MNTLLYEEWSRVRNHHFAATIAIIDSGKKPSRDAKTIRQKLIDE